MVPAAPSPPFATEMTTSFRVMPAVLELPSASTPYSDSPGAAVLALVRVSSERVTGPVSAFARTTYAPVALRTAAEGLGPVLLSDSNCAPTPPSIVRPLPTELRSREPT
jgi:hypothetical protein